MHQTTCELTVRRQPVGKGLTYVEVINLPVGVLNTCHHVVQDLCEKFCFPYNQAKQLHKRTSLTISPAPSQSTGWIARFQVSFSWSTLDYPDYYPSQSHSHGDHPSLWFVFHVQNLDGSSNRFVNNGYVNSQWKNKQSPGWASFTNHRSALRMFRFVGMNFGLYGSSVSTIMSSFA